MKNTLDEFRVYQESEIAQFADLFYSNEEQAGGDLGKLHGLFTPAIDRYKALEIEKQDIFKSTLGRFNRVYSYITQCCRFFDKDLHKFSVYAKFLYMFLPKGTGIEKIDIDDKILLEYYKLEKIFEGPIELEGSAGGYVPVSGDAGHREPKKDPLTMPSKISGVVMLRTMIVLLSCCCLLRISQTWQLKDMSRMMTSSRDSLPILK